jgi:hypothetical protein
MSVTWRGDYAVTVYCDGSADAQHEPTIVITYVRLVDESFPQGRDWVPSHKWVDGSGRVKRAREHVQHRRKGPQGRRLREAGIPHVRLQYRFHCPRCGFNEIRNDGSPLSAVFDDLAERNEAKISARELIRRAWP